MSGLVISILCPVLSRPANALPLSSSVAEGTSVPHELLFLCSPGDDEEIEACRATGARVHVTDFPPGPGDFARKINRGYELTSGEYIFLGADDLRFFRGWDEAALRVAEATGAGVIGTNDQANEAVMSGRHATHSLVARWYAEQGCTMDGSGTIYSEVYDHQCVDNELVETAQARSQWAFAGNSRVQHLHPIWHTAEMDDTYRRALAHGQEDRRLFFRRRALWMQNAHPPRRNR